MPRKPFVLLAMMMTMLSIASTVSAAPHKHHSATTVAKDAPGDWGGEIAPGLGPVGEALGQDLVAARIAAHPDTIDFEIVTTSLPETASLVGIYVWDFTVDGQSWRLSNSTCDPSQYVSATPSAPESCAPSEEAGTAFEVMECGGARLVNISASCDFAADVIATIDASAATISIPVPREIIRAKKGSVIAPMQNDDDAIVSGTAFPYGGATPFPGDNMMWSRPFKIRK